MMEPTITLSNGIKMPQLGFGTYKLGPYDDAFQAIKSALNDGYRSFDTAAYYGTEPALGDAIRDSGYARKDVFITSKVWLKDAGYEQTLAGFRETLSRLETTYLDLYLIHMPIGDWQGSWKALQSLYAAGKVRAIGVANFNQEQLETLRQLGGEQPMVDQIELHPFCQQKPLRQYLSDHNIAVEAWAPFARGMNHLFENQQLQKIADNHEASIAEIILRWLRDQGIITIPKTVHEDRMRDNRDLRGIKLTADERQIIDNLDQNKPLLLDLSKQSEIERLKGLPFNG